MIVFVENPKESPKSPRINEFSKDTGYKINIHKLIVLPYTSNEYMDPEIRNTITFVFSQERIKCQCTSNKTYLRLVF